MYNCFLDRYEILEFLSGCIDGELLEKVQALVGMMEAQLASCLHHCTSPVVLHATHNVCKHTFSTMTYMLAYTQDFYGSASIK